MFGFKGKVRLGLCLLMVVFLFSSSLGLLAQETEKKENPQKEMIPSFIEESLVKDAPQINAADLLKETAEKLGGYKGYQEIKDLSYHFRHKYYKDDILNFIENADGKVRFAENMNKYRMDFAYPRAEDLEATLDYREVYGEDGPFKYYEGKVVRTPVAIRLAGERLLRYHYTIFAPFIFDLKAFEPKYVGVVTWKEFKKEKEIERKCHKVVVRFKGKQANIIGNAISLYIDVKSKNLRRLIYNMKSAGNPDLKRTRIVDFIKRIKVKNIELPFYLYVQEYQNDQFHAVHRIEFSNYQPNTGLEGVGFEMMTQEKYAAKTPVRTGDGKKK